MSEKLKTRTIPRLFPADKKNFPSVGFIDIKVEADQAHFVISNSENITTFPFKE